MCGEQISAHLLFIPTLLSGGDNLAEKGYKKISKSGFEGAKLTKSLTTFCVDV